MLPIKCLLSGNKATKLSVQWCMFQILLKYVKFGSLENVLLLSLQTAWEQQYRQRPNALKKFLETWKKVQLQTEPLPSNRKDEEEEDEEDEDSEVCQ